MRAWFSKRLVLAVVLVAGLGFGVGRYGGFADGLLWADEGVRQPRYTAESAGLSRLENLNGEAVTVNLLWDLWELAQTRHIDAPASNQSLLIGAINGLFQFGYKDRYSFLLPPSYHPYLPSAYDAEVGSSGIVFDIVEGELVVGDVRPNEAAAEAGVQVGDVIERINNERLVGKRLIDIELALSGRVGELLPLSLRRLDQDGRWQTLDKELRLTPIGSQTVAWQRVGNDVGWVRVFRFTQDTARQFAAALEQLGVPSGGLVLDLRGNTGGAISGVAEMAGRLLGPEVVYQLQPPGEQAEPVHSTTEAQLGTLPVVVLINRGTASAAEILAAALQESGRASLIGSTTFGKGVAMRFEGLSIEGEQLPAVLGLVQAAWLTPEGNSVEQVGLTPDVPVAADRPESEWQAVAERELQRLFGLQQQEAE